MAPSSLVCLVAALQWTNAMSMGVSSSPNRQAGVQPAKAAGFGVVKPSQKLASNYVPAGTTGLARQAANFKNMAEAEGVTQKDVWVRALPRAPLWLFVGAVVVKGDASAVLGAVAAQKSVIKYAANELHLPVRGAQTKMEFGLCERGSNPTLEAWCLQPLIVAQPANIVPVAGLEVVMTKHAPVEVDAVNCGFRAAKGELFPDALGVKYAAFNERERSTINLAKEFKPTGSAAMKPMGKGVGKTGG
ncbi:hypothetical protein M885DRAFT_524098 [Pelagophyceae sp. CCMP2097]|nr:hypothetical protein M885DRAFT_524098 [Pelagophyceae sp. CCMP2097]|mmetsp:Transcript_3003/g.8975  ORF Transcript_3003/g.8975 Transcript_3003/m.8975 type:complete len:246 (-) Transcript_3003:33-770(-)